MDSSNPESPPSYPRSTYLSTAVRRLRSQVSDDLDNRKRIRPVCIDFLKMPCLIKLKEESGSCRLPCLLILV